MMRLPKVCSKRAARSVVSGPAPQTICRKRDRSSPSRSLAPRAQRNARTVGTTLVQVQPKVARVFQKALAENHHLGAGLNVHRGKVTYEAVARDLGYAFEPVSF